MSFSFARFLLPLTLGAPIATLAFAAGPQEVTEGLPHPLRVAGRPAGGDTTADTSETALTRMALSPLSDSPRVAALRLAALAASRHDDARELVWRAVAYLENETNVKVEDEVALYAQLVPLYARVLASHGPVPDVIPGVLPVRPASQPPLDLDHYLDRQWGALYDRSVPMGTPAATPGSGSPRGRRLVVGEYITAVGCPTCWQEDRAESAVMQHFGQDRFVALGIHYFPHDAPGNDSEDLLRRLLEWYPTDTAASGQEKLRPAVIPRTSVSSLPSGSPWIGLFVDGHQLLGGEAAVGAHHVAEVVVAELGRAPEAAVHVGVQTHGDTIVTQVRVDSLRGVHARLALRIALIEDTVRIIGIPFTNRRLHFNVVRAAARTPQLPLGIPVANKGPSTVTYTFNLATLRAELAAQRDTALQGKDGLDREQPENRLMDPRNWQIDPARLHVVAFVQDLVTGKVLQAARVPVYDTHTPRTAFNR